MENIFDGLKAELHTHSVYSNPTSIERSPRGLGDCETTPKEILETMIKKKLNVLVITDHDTVTGYQALMEKKTNNPERYGELGIYKGQEITTDKNEHIGGLFIDDYIKPNRTIEEIIDDVKKNNGIAVAEHPYAVKNGMRDKAKLFDHIETFNSNNRDGYSNPKAEELATKYNKIKLNGSDSHLTSTLGIAPNLIYSKNNLDDLREAVSKGKMRPLHTRRLRSFEESIEHGHYIINSSKDNLLKYLDKKQEKLSYLSKDFVNKFVSKYIGPRIIETVASSSPKSILYKGTATIFMNAIKRSSYNVNVKGRDPNKIENNFIWRNLKTLF